MTLNHPYSGGSLVAEFQVAPAPWITQSAIPTGGANTVMGFDFPTVARSFTFLNHGSG
jgi:hypothetical protein